MSPDAQRPPRGNEADVKNFEPAGTEVNRDDTSESGQRAGSAGRTAPPQPPTPRRPTKKPAKPMQLYCDGYPRGTFDRWCSYRDRVQR